jgi:hypothetical protein
MFTGENLIKLPRRLELNELLLSAQILSVDENLRYRAISATAFDHLSIGTRRQLDAQIHSDRYLRHSYLLAVQEPTRLPAIGAEGAGVNLNVSHRLSLSQDRLADLTLS